MVLLSEFNLSNPHEQFVSNSNVHLLHPVAMKATHTYSAKLNANETVVAAPKPDVSEQMKTVVKQRRSVVEQKPNGTAYLYSTAKESVLDNET